MSKLETSENAEDNKGNSENSEIVHRCDSCNYFLSFPMRAWSERLCWKTLPGRQLSTEGGHKLSSLVNQKDLP